MKNLIKLLILLSILNTMVYAVPIVTIPAMPVIDTQRQQDELTSISVYLANLETLIKQISRTTSAQKQISNLNNLVSTQNYIRNICNKYCSQADRVKIQNYVDDINNNMLNKFNDYAGVTDNNAKSMKELITLLSVSGATSNTTSMSLSLQQASQVTLAQVSQMLEQIQSLLLLNAQKQQMEDKLDKANSEAIYSGFAKSGL